MKIRSGFPLVLCLCLLSAPANGRTSHAAASQHGNAPVTATQGPGSDATVPAKIDPAKEADIKRLMELAGGVAAANQVMDGMMKNMKPMMVNAFPPGEYRDKLIDLFFEKFRSKADIQQLLDLNIRIYDKYLSDEDIQGLIQFYSTPLGQKTLSILPKLTVEAQAEGVK